MILLWLCSLFTASYGFCSDPCILGDPCAIKADPSNSCVIVPGSAPGCGVINCVCLGAGFVSSASLDKCIHCDDPCASLPCGPNACEMAYLATDQGDCPSGYQCTCIPPYLTSKDSQKCVLISAPLRPSPAQLPAGKTRGKSAFSLSLAPTPIPKGNGDSRLSSQTTSSTRDSARPPGKGKAKPRGEKLNLPQSPPPTSEKIRKGTLSVTTPAGPTSVLPTPSPSFYRIPTLSKLHASIPLSQKRAVITGASSTSPSSPPLQTILSQFSDLNSNQSVAASDPRVQTLLAQLLTQLSALSSPANLPSMYLQSQQRPLTASSRAPSNFPSARPTTAPTRFPSLAPTRFPSLAPTNVPTQRPSSTPTSHPTRTPTKAPTTAPSGAPTYFPTEVPTTRPTGSPTAAPEDQEELSGDEVEDSDELDQSDDEEADQVHEIGPEDDELTPESITYEDEDLSFDQVSSVPTTTSRQEKGGKGKKAEPTPPPTNASMDNVLAQLAILSGQAAIVRDDPRLVAALMQLVGQLLLPAPTTTATLPSVLPTSLRTSPTSPAMMAELDDQRRTGTPTLGFSLSRAMMRSTANQPSVSSIATSPSQAEAVRNRERLEVASAYPARPSNTAASFYGKLLPRTSRPTNRWKRNV